MSAGRAPALQGHRQPTPEALHHRITNVDFDAWAQYLGDAPLAMAMLDRLVDGAVIIRIKGPSFRANRPSATAG